jgi:acyl-coenzyme A thioesterase PaaI-like protein
LADAPAGSANSAPAHIIHELGFDLERVGEHYHGFARVVPELYSPSTTSVRASIFATWTDIAAGYHAVDTFNPRVPTTLELDVHLHQHTGEYGEVHAVSRLIKAGRSVLVAMVDFTDETGRSVAFGTASFMPVPDVTMRIPPEHEALRRQRRPAGRLRRPFAERAGCERRSPGVAVLHRAEDGLNSSNTVNGGLIALTVEETALPATPASGAVVSSLAMRYLRPVRVGPAVATAQVQDGLGRVEVRDGGSDDRLAVYAITRTTVTGTADLAPAGSTGAAA